MTIGGRSSRETEWMGEEGEKSSIVNRRVWGIHATAKNQKLKKLKKPASWTNTLPPTTQFRNSVCDCLRKPITLLDSRFGPVSQKNRFFRTSGHKRVSGWWWMGRDRQTDTEDDLWWWSAGLGESYEEPRTGPTVRTANVSPRRYAGVQPVRTPSTSPNRSHVSGTRLP